MWLASLPPDTCPVLAYLFSLGVLGGSLLSVDEPDPSTVSADLETFWSEEGLSGLPKGVLESLHKVTPPNGLLSFERFCAGLKICLLRYQADQHRGQGGSGLPQRSPSAPILDRCPFRSASLLGTGVLRSRHRSPFRSLRVLDPSAASGTLPRFPPSNPLTDSAATKYFSGIVRSSCYVKGVWGSTTGHTSGRKLPVSNQSRGAPLPGA